MKDILEGSITCINCKKKYFIIDGVPKMIISNEEIITHSNNLNFIEFILTPKNLDKWIKNSKTRFNSN